MKIKAMKERGLSLSEIKRVLAKDQNLSSPGVSTIDLLAHRLANLVRKEGYEFFQSGLQNH